MNAIIPGSLSAISQATGGSLAESFMQCDMIILADMSGSMGANDAPGGKSRFDAAEAEIIRLQKDNPGKIGLIVFSSTVEFCPAGIPRRLGGSTDLKRGLEFIRPVDDTGVQIVLVSDGVPNDPEGALKVARQFKTPISACYIGPEDDREGGRAFLKKLAQATGGAFHQSKAPGLLAEPVTLLLAGK